MYIYTYIHTRVDACQGGPATLKEWQDINLHQIYLTLSPTEIGITREGSLWLPFQLQQGSEPERGTVDVLKANSWLPSTPMRGPQPKHMYSKERSYKKACGSQPYAASK